MKRFFETLYLFFVLFPIAIVIGTAIAIYTTFEFIINNIKIKTK